MHPMEIRGSLPTPASLIHLDRAGEGATEGVHSAGADLKGLHKVCEKRQTLLCATRKHHPRVCSAEVPQNREQKHSDPRGLLAKNERRFWQDVQALLHLGDDLLKLNESIHSIVKILR